MGLNKCTNRGWGHDALVNPSYKFVRVDKCHSDIKMLWINKVFHNHFNYYYYYYYSRFYY